MNVRTFTQSDGATPFHAWDEARRWLTERGFSVGRMQAHAPTGLLFGEYDVQKWRDLNREDRAALDALAEGDYRNGPITVRLMKRARIEAVAALLDSDAEVERWAEDNFVRGDE
jgi:hypothetical protein